MTHVRHKLQKDIFQPNEERLLAVINVTKVNKKKRDNYLCISVTIDPPVAVTINQVKPDKNSFKKKNSWSLRELKLVDAKESEDGKENPEFELQLDRVYKWVSSNLHEKKNFIVFLYKMCKKYLPRQKIKFINLPKQLIEEVECIKAPAVLQDAVPELDDVELESITLTEKESADLAALLAKASGVSEQAEAFAEQLARDLGALDGANIQSMLASEMQVNALMTVLDLAMSEADSLENQLIVYEDMFSPVRQVMEKVEEENAGLETAANNNILLVKELQLLVHQKDLSPGHHLILRDADFRTPQSIAEATEAAHVLWKALEAQVHPALNKLTAVDEQHKELGKVKQKFSNTLCAHLNRLFIHLGNDPGDTLSLHANDLTLPKHTFVHKELLPFAPLMHWLKAMDRKAYDTLAKVYVTSLSKLYERNLRLFFEEAKSNVVGYRRAKGSGSSQDLSKTIRIPIPPTGSTRSSTSSGSGGGGESSEGAPGEYGGPHQKFDETLERVLEELEPVCMDEQKFCVTFFQLEVPVDVNVDSSPCEPEDNHQRRLEKQLNEEVRKLVGGLFASLEPELLAFISFHEKNDPYCSLYALLRLSGHVLWAQDAGSFLAMAFANALVLVKRSFDRFAQSQLRLVEEAKPTRKGKGGILPFVLAFEEFAHTVESVSKGSDRRADVDKWYGKLVRALFEAIPRVAQDQQKMPADVIKMENFHHLHAQLSSLKVVSLEPLRKDAKQRYKDSLSAYVTQYFGRPLEKLNQFFDGVQSRVNQGVKESEVCYQLAFSKQELRKVIKEYPVREVRKGLDALYRKVEKHLSDEENLIQVVWRAMQEEFIRQYKSIEELIGRCYPGSMITLEFSIEDILSFFSDIARSH